MQPSTELNGRVLRFDGTSIISPEEVTDALLNGIDPSSLRVTHLTPDLFTFNENVEPEKEIRLNSDEPISLHFDWKLPKEYLELDVYQRVGEAYESHVSVLYQTYSQKQYDAALDRISTELSEFEKRGMVNFLRTVIYVLDVFKEKNVVWGVGRGSSCASYVLFLLGLHAVDPVLYDIPLDEFFHN